MLTHTYTYRFTHTRRCTHTHIQVAQDVIHINTYRYLKTLSICMASCTFLQTPPPLSAHPPPFSPAAPATHEEERTGDGVVAGVVGRKMIKTRVETHTAKTTLCWQTSRANPVQCCSTPQQKTTLCWRGRLVCGMIECM